MDWRREPVCRPVAEDGTYVAAGDSVVVIAPTGWVALRREARLGAEAGVGLDEGDGMSPKAELNGRGIDGGVESIGRYVIEEVLWIDCIAGTVEEGGSGAVIGTAACC